MGTAITKANVREELGTLKAELQQGKLADVASKLNQELHALENTTVNIAITGHSGVGKSSLVNALRGMGDSDKDSAKTGVTQTTMDVHKYIHPNFPNVIIWDLPGIGTPNFKAEEYLKKVTFERYDFFIIAAGERFTELDGKLATEIKEMEKNFYYVRTKLDQATDSERNKPKFNEQEILSEIRNYCCANLVKAGEPSPRVFLISNRHLDKYDFPLLQEAFVTDLDTLKKNVLIMALPVFSEEVINQKKAVMKDLILKVAFVSCAVAAVPIPGLSLACDMAILVATMIKMYHVFGLDEDSLRRLEKRVGKPVNELKSAIKKTPISSQITKEFIIDILANSMVWVTTSAIELVLNFIPVLGSLFGGVSSFATMYYMLNSFLQDMVKDVENVRRKALVSLKSQATRKGGDT